VICSIIKPLDFVIANQNEQEIKEAASAATVCLNTGNNTADYATFVKDAFLLMGCVQHYSNS
jgi:hypothetical protein